MTPAPMITVFGRHNETVSNAVITDSLHRARPARFSGSDLSRFGYAASTAQPPAPQPRPQCRTRALPMQGFSRACRCCGGCATGRPNNLAFFRPCKGCSSISPVGWLHLPTSLSRRVRWQYPTNNPTVRAQAHRTRRKPCSARGPADSDRRVARKRSQSGTPTTRDRR